MQALLEAGAEQLGLALADHQLEQFIHYSRELVAWNRRINLTRITEPEAIVNRHFLDSLSVLLALADLPPAFSLVDVGSGAGFPGLPLKIARPDIDLALVESIGKKVAFLEHIVAELGLGGVSIWRARAEELGHRAEHRQRYDVAVARAVAGLPVLAEYMLPLVKLGGRMVAQKGQRPTAELEEAAAALEILGGQVERVLPVLELEAARHLVVIRKERPTPARYPRRPGLPAKRPLL